MNLDVFRNISLIIERDSKSTTYKFALLRGVIDIIQENSPYIKVVQGRVHFPLGLLVEKWLVYYYPILESEVKIPQINSGRANLAFEESFNKVISFYKTKGGFSVFYNDLTSKGIPIEIQEEFISLCRNLRQTITRMPMKYIGRSISEDFYSIFEYKNYRFSSKGKEIDLLFLINNLGEFSIPREYFESFKAIGSFINGQDSILFKWAEFSVIASGQRLSIQQVMNEVLRTPVTTREVNESKILYKNILKEEGQVFCVWTGSKISKYDIDHMIPFSVWKNNDLWNLLPTRGVINSSKSNKIPSPILIEKQKELILKYWHISNKYFPKRFQKEIEIALLGNPSHDWVDTGIKQLKYNCEHLINIRGFEEWKI